MAVSYLTAEQLNREIGLRKYRAVYYFYGEEDYRKTEAIKFILNDYIPQQQRLLNFTRLSAEKNEFEMICNELAAIPMLGERRIIVIDEAQKLGSAQQTRLFGLLQPPPPETIIIFVSPAANTPRKTSAFYKAITDIAQPVQFDRLTKNQSISRIEKQLQAAGYTYDREAIDLLVELTDGNFGGLTGELDKLALIKESGSHIDIETIKQVASSHEDFSIFELIDFIAEAKSDGALRAYHDLVQKGMRPATLLYQLSAQMLNLLKVHAGKQVRGAPFFVRRLQEQSRQFGLEKALRAIEKIALVEREIRRSQIKPPVLVENLIREISR